MPYQKKPLSCDPAKIKGMSERLIISDMDFGAKAASYVDTFMNVIRWNNAERLYVQMSEGTGANTGQRA